MPKRPGGAKSRCGFEISIRAPFKRLLGTRFAANCAAGSAADAKVRPLPADYAASSKTTTIRLPSAVSAA